MKNKIIYVFLILVMTVVSCKKDFTVRSTLTGSSLDNFYNTADEVRASTSTLYSGLPWAGFMSRGLDDIGDVMSGNAHSYEGNGDYRAFVVFSQSAATPLVLNCWSAYYKVGGWAAAYLKNFELKKTLGGDPAFLDPGIAECQFMLGVTYFYIGRTFGDAPIIDDPGQVALTGNYNIPKYLQRDVLRFAIEQMKLAEAGLPENDVPGRVTKSSARAYLAKMYLYNKDYTNAAAKALEVMNSGKYNLVPRGLYATMFNSSSMNNNIESIFAIQYQLTQNPWGAGCQLQCDRGPSNLNTSESSMWELFRPSIDFKNAFEPNDLRRPATIMEQGWKMPDWKPQNADADYNAFMAKGYVYDSVPPTNKGGIKNATRSNIAKYVVGPGSSYGGEQVLGMNTGQNFMMMRYADVLLIYAEAVLGENASTSDAGALDAYNRVRTRAGLGAKTSITKDDIMHERRVEFAFEGDYWFDIQRQGYAKAKEIIEAQNRGDVDNPLYVTFNENNMYLPIPATELLQDPELAKDPVPYYKDK
jgi:starch-binding outer membrane protein, SusD/RagB family